MRKQGTINYELLINEPDGTGIIHESNLDSDIAALFISYQVLRDKIAWAEQLKAEAKNKDERNAYNREIKLLIKGKASIDRLLNAIIPDYDIYAAAIRAQKEAQKMADKDQTPKP
jgi:predicted  nucleic acid-binding Zn-ribbon protein